MAHRGNRVRYPENTLSAFQQAVSDGADIIETNIHLTSDGEVVCIHDSTVDRTIDGAGRVDSLTLRELRGLNAAARREELAPEPIPTLLELTDLLPPDVGLAVELKAEAFFQPQNMQKVTALLYQAGIQDRCFALSFKHQQLEAIRQVQPPIPMGWITLSKPYPISGFEMIGPYWPLLFVNPFYVLWAHLLEQLICPLDPVPEPRLWYYLRIRCDAVLSDDPGTTCRALGRSESRYS